MPSIFCTPTSVGLKGRSSSLAKVGWMALVLLPKSSKTSCYGHPKPMLIFPELNQVSNARNLFKSSPGAPSTLVSSTWRLPRLSLVFYIIVFLWLGTLCRVVTILVAVETSDKTQVFARRAGNVGGLS